MMKAMALSYNGKARRVDVSKPTPSSDEVLVKVEMSALDTATPAVLDKTWMGFFTHKKTNPLVLGWHYMGTVVELGAEVESLQINDTVWGFLQVEPNQDQGSFSEYITVNTKDTAKFEPSTRLTKPVAAAASTESLTALQAMRDLGGLSKGKLILILGAGGGVGSVAVGIAKRLGAHVTAVVSRKDVERVKKLGADKVIDRSELPDPLEYEGDTKYDVIFDTPCAYSVRKCMTKLKPKGTYVTGVLSWNLFVGMLLSPFTGKGAKLVLCHSNTKDLKLVGEWLQDGLVVDIDSTFKVKDLEKAIVRQRDRSKVGRVVIEVESGWE